MERIILKLMGTKDFTITNKLQQASQKFTHHNVENEPSGLMAKQVLSKNLETIRKRHFYSITFDEETDRSNIG